MPNARRDLGITALWLVVILGLKWNTLWQPPVWDTAMSIFQSGIQLSDCGFDVAWTVKQPGLSQGGPNVHSLSLGTWFTAAAVSVWGESPQLFTMLHLAQFLILAVGLTTLYEFSRPVVGSALSAAVCLATLLVPLVSTQAGYLYVEIPLLLCTLAALNAWSAGSWKQASFWAFLAVWIKPSGVVLVGTLALAAILESRHWKQRLVRVAGILSAPVLLIVCSRLLVNPAAQAGKMREIPSYLNFLAESIVNRVGFTPDILVLLLTVLLLGMLRARRLFTALVRNSDADRDAEHTCERRLALCHLLVWSFAAFFLLLPLTGHVVTLLTRYFVIIVPALLLILTEALRRLISPAAAWIGLIGLIGFCVLNRDGGFYPAMPEGNDMSIAERSGEYRDLLYVQRKGVRALEDVETDVAKFYGLTEHYQVNLPGLGYVRQPLANGRCALFDKPYSEARLSDYPDHFYLLLLHPYVGGERLKKVWLDATRSDQYEVTTIKQFDRGSFSGRLVEIQRKD